MFDAVLQIGHRFNDIGIDPEETLRHPLTVRPMLRHLALKFDGNHLVDRFLYRQRQGIGRGSCAPPCAGNQTPCQQASSDSAPPSTWRFAFHFPFPSVGHCDSSSCCPQWPRFSGLPARDASAVFSTVISRTGEQLQAVRQFHMEMTEHSSVWTSTSTGSLNLP